MRAARSQANVALALEQPTRNHNPTSPQNIHTQSDHAAPSKTTTHRYLLSSTLAVSTSIDWMANGANSDSDSASAFFRLIARRLIDIH